MDEAFLDATPEATLIGAAAQIVVLRSLGKFFGLAGVRLGFVLASAAWHARLRDRLSPWAVSHPARWAARLALTDHAWQAAQRQRLVAASARLAALLSPIGCISGTALFRYVITPRAAALHEALAQRGILVRLFDAPAALRFGLPATEADWERLASSLRSLT